MTGLLFVHVVSVLTLSLHSTGCKTELQMMYAGSKLGLVKDGGFTKVSNYATGQVLTLTP